MWLSPPIVPRPGGHLKDASLPQPQHVSVSCDERAIRRAPRPVDGRIVAACVQVVQCAQVRRDDPRAAGPAVGRGCRAARPDRPVDLRSGLHDLRGLRPSQVGRRVRLHPRSRLSPAIGDAARYRQVIFSRLRGGPAGRPRREELPDRDHQPAAPRRGHRTADRPRGQRVLLLRDADFRPQVRCTAPIQ
jgi:hypothetical protein